MRFDYTKPVRGGYAYFNLIDRQRQNFALMVLFRDYPDAEKLIRRECARLNGENL